MVGHALGSPQVIYSPSEPQVDLGDGLFMHERALVVVRGGEYDVDIEIGVREGRLAADRVSVWPASTSAPGVSSEALRRLPIAAWVREAAAAVLYVTRELPAGRQVALARPTPDEVAHVEAHGLDEETLRTVARTYRVAYLIGAPPTKAVEEQLQLPRSTAGRWVAAARARGFLSESRGAGKAGV